MTNMQDIQKKSDQELVELTQASREAVRTERFKDKFSKNAAVIRSNKKDVARALTELNARRNKPVTN
jgi:ribosomal protein L29